MTTIVASAAAFFTVASACGVGFGPGLGHRRVAALAAVLVVVAASGRDLRTRPWPSWLLIVIAGLGLVAVPSPGFALLAAVVVRELLPSTLRELGSRLLVLAFGSV